jgi:hypothetical protein
MKCLFMCVVLAFAYPGAADPLRDPTRPPVPRAPTATEPVPVLSAIIGADGERIAIFNGRVVRSGASVGAYLITSIHEDGITYRHAGLTRDLQLPHTASFKRAPTSAARQPKGFP